MYIFYKCNVWPWKYLFKITYDFESRFGLTENLSVVGSCVPPSLTPKLSTVILPYYGVFITINEPVVIQYH